MFHKRQATFRIMTYIMYPLLLGTPVLCHRGETFAHTLHPTNSTRDAVRFARLTYTDACLNSRVYTTVPVLT
eukprot:COSAG06_NODE_4330_length_4360_cov_5.475710_3_plen_72_part_00